MELITGHMGRPHVTSEQHRSVFEKIIGKDSYILDGNERLEPELQSNQSIRIRSGMLCHHGSISEIKRNTYDEVTIANGSQGMKRIDLIVARYEKNPETEIETMKWTVIRGTPSSASPTVPSHTKGNMQNGDMKDDCPVFKVYLEGIQVTKVEKLLGVLSVNLSTVPGKIAAVEEKCYKFISSNDAMHKYQIGNEINVVGTVVKTSTSDWVELFNAEKLHEFFGQNFDMSRFSITTYNGDAANVRVHFYQPDLWNGIIYQYFYPQINGPIRINYHMKYLKK